MCAEKNAESGHWKTAAACAGKRSRGGGVCREAVAGRCAPGSGCGSGGDVRRGMAAQRREELDGGGNVRRGTAAGRWGETGRRRERAPKVRRE